MIAAHSRSRSRSVWSSHSGAPRPPRRRLSAEEERELVERAAAGDQRALADLVDAHFALVVLTAARYQGTGVALEDLVGEGCVGLLEAVSRFDASRGNRFMTYAVWWIRRRLVEASHAQSRNVQIPRARQSRMTDAERERRRLRGLREVSLTPDPAGGDSPIERQVAEQGACHPDAELLRHEEAKAVRDAVSRLGARSRQVIGRRFGLDLRDEDTLVAVAGQLGVSKERVRQIEQSALGQLRLRLAPLRA